MAVAGSITVAAALTACAASPQPPSAEEILRRSDEAMNRLESMQVTLKDYANQESGRSASNMTFAYVAPGQVKVTESNNAKNCFPVDNHLWAHYADGKSKIETPEDLRIEGEEVYEGHDTWVISYVTRIGPASYGQLTNIYKEWIDKDNLLLLRREQRMDEASRLSIAKVDGTDLKWTRRVWTYSDFNEPIDAECNYQN